MEPITQLPPTEQGPSAPQISNSQSFKFLTIILILLLVAALAFVGYFYYKAKESRAFLYQKEAQTVVEKLPISEYILPSPGYGISTYASSTAYEKSLVQGFLKVNSKFIQDTKSDNPNAISENLLNIKYYNEDTVVIETLAVKGSRLCIYDIHTFKYLGDRCFPFNGPFNEFKDYILAVEDKEIYYYKKGAPSFVLLSEATLSGSNETYTAIGGAGGLSPELSFNETTKELQIGVFDSRYDDNGVSTKKLRTANFTLSQ